MAMTDPEGLIRFGEEVLGVTIGLPDDEPGLLVKQLLKYAHGYEEG